jgi:HlyD family secretion protein
MKKIGILIIIGILLWSCSAKVGKAGKKDDVKLRTATVKRGKITVELEETGEIRPIKEIEIKSKVSGKIIRFYVDEGDFVKKGDLIADIEPDYNQAEQISRVKSNLDLAKIRLDNRTKDLEDVKKLFTENFASRNQLENAQNALTEASINYQSAWQQYELIREIETEDNVSKLLSVASGTVISKLVEEGEMVVSSVSSYSAGTVILKIADLERMIVKTKINEIDISKIHTGQKVKIKVDAYPYQDYFGNIIKIAAMAADFSNVKVFPIEIEIKSVDEKLRPGMTANVTIIGEERKDILVIPIRAIFSDEMGQDIVYKVENDSISGPLPIKTGINDFQQVEIVDGLEEDMQISLSEPAKKEEKKEKK